MPLTCPSCNRAIGFRWFVLAMGLSRNRCPGCSTKLHIGGRQWPYLLSGILLGLIAGPTPIVILIGCTMLAERYGVLPGVLAFILTLPAFFALLIMVYALPWYKYLSRRGCLEIMTKAHLVDDIKDGLISVLVMTVIGLIIMTLIFRYFFRESLVSSSLWNLSTNQALLSSLRNGDTNSAIKYLEERQRRELAWVEEYARDEHRPELLTNSAVLKARNLARPKP